MRIGIAARILQYDGFGVHTFLNGFLSALTSAVTIDALSVYIPPNYSPKETSLSKYCKTIGLPASNGLSRIFWDQCSVPSAAKADKVDILYYPSHTCCIAAPCPRIVTVHDMMYHLFPQWWSKAEVAYFRAGLHFTTKHANWITVDSISTKRDLLQYINIPEERVRVIYPGAPCDLYLPLEEEITTVLNRYDIKQPYVLAVISGSPRKNLHDILKTFAIIAKSTSCQLVIINSPYGDVKGIKRAVANASLTNRTKILGTVPRQAISAIYAGAELLLSASLYEGFGFPILEAMVCGCPVVAYNNSSIAEVAGEAAVLVENRNVEQLTDATISLLESTEKRNCMKLLGLDRARLFSWERAIAEFLELAHSTIKSI